jgi:hypothetical protein
MANEQNWRLCVELVVEEIDPRSGGVAYGNNRLSVREELSIGSGTFMEVAQLLARFHELAKASEMLPTP